MNKTLKKKILFIIIISLLLTLTGCKKQKQYSKTYFEYFDTVITISGYEKSIDDFNKKLEIIEPLLKEYHILFDIYYEYNNVINLCTINKKAYLEPLTVDQEIINMLEYGFNMYSKTMGMLNIAMGSVLMLWHNERDYASEYPHKATLPKIEKLEEASKYMNIEDVVINREDSTIFIKNKFTKLDVGAVAKGYACEQISQVLIKNNANSYILNFGGNIKLIGSKPKNKDFKVGVQDPNSQNNLVVLNLKNYSVVTSGSYQRYYIVNGERYHHIINPKTLMPENNYLSVTIVSKNSTLCDCLSTALFNLSIDEGKEILKQFDDTYSMWVDVDNNITYSDGFENFIKG